MNPLIKVEGLVQKIRREKILDGISFEVFPGECFGVFGLRGAGKTALLHVLAGLDRFAEGRVEVLGCDSRRSEKFKQDLGLVTQQPSLFQDLNTVENLDFIATLKKAPPEAVARAIERFQLNDYLHKPLSLLPAGVFQRLALACALLNNPKLLLADQIMKEIDLDSRDLIIQVLKAFQENGGTIVCALSGPDFSEYTSRVGWLANGQMSIFEPAAFQAEWRRQSQFQSRRCDHHEA
jgi:ABC-2 type transport system ATP-binding protein